MSWKIFARVTSHDDVIWVAQTKIALNSYTMMFTLLWIAQTDYVFTTMILAIELCIASCQLYFHIRK